MALQTKDAEAAGREVKIGLNGFVILEDTEKEAKERLREIVAGANTEAVEAFRSSVKEAGAATGDGKGMWAESSFEDLIQYNDGFKTGLIGTREQIEERIDAYRKVGVDLILTGFLHFDEELQRFGREIIGYDAGRAARPARPAIAAGVIGAVVLAWVAAFAPMASAQGGQEDAPGKDAQAAIVMDASSSMLEPDEGGTRMDVAKRAATELVDSLPDTANVGMLAYGTQVIDAPENHERGCEDIRTLAPVGRVDKEGLKGEIDGLQAQGYTPIGNALRAAGGELSGEGERSIILVSDGIDTCAPPPPCEVAKELADEGIGLAVHVVGFKADEATREEAESALQSWVKTEFAAHAFPRKVHFVRELPKTPSGKVQRNVLRAQRKEQGAGIGDEAAFLQPVPDHLRLQRSVARHQHQGQRDRGVRIDLPLQIDLQRQRAGAALQAAGEGQRRAELAERTGERHRRAGGQGG